LETASLLSNMNVTPLIDVMLVLLIMFIITIPSQTHAVKIDVPNCAGCPKPKAMVNMVTINPTNQIAWNGTPISKRDLGYLVREMQQISPEPELHLRPDARARYGTVDEVLAIMKRANVRKFGFIGNEAYANLKP